jgi:hypothetical protein
MGFLNSLLNLFSGSIKCPACGMPGAKKVGDRIECINPLCQNFDAARASTQPPVQPTAPPRAGSSAPPGTVAYQPQSPAPQPKPGQVAIQYRNFRGENKTFLADASSLQRKNNHIVATVAPKRRTIALSRDRIQNLSEVDAVLPERDRSDAPRPTPRERQVLGYHRKHGTTSPLYEKIKAKYPNW